MGIMKEIGPGTQLGIYKLVSKLGAGGMGEVWRGEDTRLGREVAIKILPREMSGDEESKARLLREARTAAQLNHTNIATIHAIDQIEDRWFIVMELVEGRPLTDAIRAKSLTESDVCVIAKGVASALGAAHRNSIVHRDIKPDNIIVSGEHVKVLDFGIAKRVGPPGAGPATVVTQAGIVLGTVHYMSPEQALGKPLDGRSDIYSLGVVMFEAITGQLPFQGDTTTEVLTKIIRDEPPRVASLNSFVSTKLAEVIEKCLKKKPEDRFQNAGHLIRAIDEAEQFIATAQSPTAILPATRVDESGSRRLETVGTGPAPAAGMSRGKWALAVALILVVAVVGAMVMKHAKKRQKVESATAPVKVAAVAPRSETAPAADTSTASTDTAMKEPEVHIEEKEPPDVANEASVPEQGSAQQSETASPPGGPRSGPGGEMTVPAPASDMTADGWFQQGARALEAHDPQRAMEDFRRALAIDPNHAKTHLKVGEMLLIRGNRMMAANEFQRAIENEQSLSDREKSLAHLWLAAARGNRVEAESLLEDHQRRFPNDPELEAIGRILHGQRKPFRRPRRPGFPR